MSKELVEDRIFITVPIQVWYDKETGIISDYRLPTARELDKHIPLRVSTPKGRMP